MHVEALADAHGRFSMKLAPGSYTLLTNRIGYHGRKDSIEVPRDGGLYLEISIRENTIRLSPMSPVTSGKSDVLGDVLSDPTHR